MSTQTLITAVEFEKMAGRLGPCELVRGEVVPLSPGGFPHSRIMMKLGARLERWAEEAGKGQTLGGEFGLIVERGPDTVRGADIAYYSKERLPPESSPEGFSDVPPNLVVEIAGKGQGWREIQEKVAEYLRMGVDRVWVIDAKFKRVHVFRPDAGPVVLEREDVLLDEMILPGFSCRVSALLG